MFESERVQVVEMLDREISRADRYRHPVGVVTVEKPSTEAVPQVPMEACASAMKSQLRGFDVLVQTSPNGFTIVLPALPNLEAIESLETVRDRLHEQAGSGGWGSVHIGVATYPGQPTYRMDVKTGHDLLLVASADRSGGDMSANIWGE